MDRRTESHDFRTDLGFNLGDGINWQEQTVLKLIKDNFDGENMQIQYNILGYSFDLNTDY